MNRNNIATDKEEADLAPVVTANKNDRRPVTRRRTRRPSKTCPPTTILDMALPRPLASTTVLRVASQAVFRYLLCTSGFSPWPIEQVLSIQTSSSTVQHRWHQKILRLRQQVMHFETCLANELKNSDSRVQCILLSCGTSFARPRNLYIIDASSLTRTGELILKDEAPLARKVIQSLLQHDDTSTTRSSPRQQLFLSMGVTNALAHPAEWMHRREWNLQQFLQTPCSRPPTVCHMRIIPKSTMDTRLDRLTWFSLQSTIKPVLER